VTFTPRWNTYSNPQEISVVVVVNAESDVSKAVKYANANGINFMANNRGHGFTTSISKFKGMQINVSQLRNIDIKPNKKSAVLQGGLATGDIIDALWSKGLVTTSGSNACVGLVGPALGGGYGRYQGLYGLVSDNVLVFNAVLANGQEVKVSEHNYSDLFWALKGAGHNFVIVTSLEMKVYPRSIDTWHYHNYLWEGKQLETVFTELNKVQGKGKTPAKLAVNFGEFRMNYTHSKTDAILSWTFSYMGPAAEAERILAPFNKIPAIESVQGDVDYQGLLVAQGTGAGEAIAGCNPNPLIGGSALLQDYNITAQREIYNLFNKNSAKWPDLSQRSRVYYEGYSTLKTQEIPEDSSAFPHRDEYLVVFYMAVAPPADAAAAREWADGTTALWRAGQPSRPNNVYLNYAMGYESIESMYGEQWRVDRLRRLKAKYDPQNRFRWYNPIIPA
jgi:UDP-N-acetylenolpyruvoylglucosamine reductase